MGFQTTNFSKPIKFKIFDGKSLFFDKFIHKTTVSFSIGKYANQTIFLIIWLGNYFMILGLVWLKNHDFRIRFSFNFVFFDQKHWLQNCLPNNITKLIIINNLNKIQNWTFFYHWNRIVWHCYLKYYQQNYHTKKKLNPKV